MFLYGLDVNSLKITRKKDWVHLVRDKFTAANVGEFVLPTLAHARLRIASKKRSAAAMASTRTSTRRRSEPSGSAGKCLRRGGCSGKACSCHKRGDKCTDKCRCVACVNPFGINPAADSDSADSEG